VRLLGRRIAAVITTLIWLATAASGASTTPAPSDEAGRLVFLLQYVGSDYAAAVRDGEIIDDAEYRENREFAALVAERWARLRDTVPAPKRGPLDDAVAKLRQLVDSRADPRLVRDVTEAAIPRLVEAFALRVFPRERPDPQRAATLFVENCATCHGNRGAGDGPRAKELDPPPARFIDRVRMDATPPYVFYNALTFGVANTAMASFADGFTDQERWDLAFYLWTFVPPPGDVRRPEGIVLSLRDLATRSSLELAPEVIRQAAARGQTIDEAAATLEVARLRADPPQLSDAQERLARLRQDLARSVELLRRGETEAAADVVTTSYLTEFEPLEPQIDRRDTRIRQGFERGLIDFRAALRRNDREGAQRLVAKLSDAVDQAAALFGGGASSRASRLWWLGGLVAFAALLIAFVSLRRIGKPRSVR